jgi:uncharacterized membrane protein
VRIPGDRALVTNRYSPGVHSDATAGHPADVPRVLSMRAALGTLLLFLSFTSVARVYLVSNPPTSPQGWLVAAAACASTSAWLLWGLPARAH